MSESVNETDIINVAKKAYDAINLEGARKAEFALDVLYFKDPENLNTPKYIEEGLVWVEEQLKSKNINIKQND